METAAKVREGQYFLEKLFGEKPENSTLLIWTLEDKRSRWFSRLPDQSTLNEISESKNTFFGCGFCPKGKGEHKRALRKEIMGIPGLWLDIDYGNSGHQKKSLPPDLDSAIGLVNAMPFKPTIIVQSGNGLHGYWLFKEPWIFETPNEYLTATALASKWNNLLRQKAEVHGWETDSVFDLARVLRIPGTKNLKDKGNPKECFILQENDFFIDANDVMDMIGLEDPPVQPQTPQKPVSDEGGLIMSASAEPSLERLSVLQDNDDEFAQIWNRKKEPAKDSSPSGWDMVLTHKFVQARWTDQEIVNALIFFRRTKLKCDMKLGRPDYYKNTINKARASYENSSAAKKISLIQDSKQVEKRDLTQEDKEALLKELNALLGIKILGFERYLEDPPLFYMITEAESVFVGTVDNIVSQTKFRNFLAGAMKVCMKNHKGGVWAHIVQSILDISRDVVMGQDATEEGEFLTYLVEYVGLKGKVVEDRNVAYLRKMPFEHEGEIYIFGTKFIKWLKIEYMKKYSLKQIGRFMRRIGAENTKMNFWPAGGNRTVTSVWKLPHKEFSKFKN